VNEFLEESKASIAVEEEKKFVPAQRPYQRPPSGTRRTLPPRP